MMYQATGEQKYLDEAERIIQQDCQDANGWYKKALGGGHFYQSSSARWEDVYKRQAEILVIQLFYPGIDGKGGRFVKRKQRNAVRNFITHTHVRGERFFQFASPLILDVYKRQPHQ